MLQFTSLFWGHILFKLQALGSEIAVLTPHNEAPAGGDCSLPLCTHCTCGRTAGMFAGATEGKV